jgi:hypothetical protein
VDEPTVGLDPEERVRFRNLISDLAGERLVLLSTHIVSDVEATATQHRPDQQRPSSPPRPARRTAASGRRQGVGLGCAE